MIKNINLINLIKINYKKKKYLYVKFNKQYLKILNILLTVNFIKNYFLIENKILIIFNNTNSKNIKLLYKPSTLKYITYLQLQKHTFNNNIKIILKNGSLFFTHINAIKNKKNGFLFFIIY